MGLSNKGLNDKEVIIKESCKSASGDPGWQQHVFPLRRTQSQHARHFCCCWRPSPCRRVVWWIDNEARFAIVVRSRHEQCFAWTTTFGPLGVVPSDVLQDARIFAADRLFSTAPSESPVSAVALAPSAAESFPLKLCRLPLKVYGKAAGCRIARERLSYPARHRGLLAAGDRQPNCSRLQT